MLAGRGEHEASWEGAFGQMEALLAMETGTRGQHGQDSGSGSPADSKSVCGMVGREGLMAFRGPQGGPGAWHTDLLSLSVLPQSQELLSTSELGLPISKMWVITTSQRGDGLMFVNGLQTP